jgi:hypothetical protein
MPRIYLARNPTIGNNDSCFSHHSSGHLISLGGQPLSWILWKLWFCKLQIYYLEYLYNNCPTTNLFTFIFNCM